MFVFVSFCLQALIEAVVTRLRSCVDEDVFIPLYPKKSGFCLFMLMFYNRF